MRCPWPLLLPLLIFASCTRDLSRPAEPDTTLPDAGFPVKEMKVERLPDLNVPRSLHAVAEADGELVVFGGCTTGFTLTKTAEYFSGGQWHLIPMLYPHAVGFTTQLASGDYLLGGGSSEDFGIGQSWGIERYDAARHRFEVFPMLDRKRTQAHATELEDGTLVVSGNWYSPDAIGCCPPGGDFHTVKEVAVQRTNPYILPVSPDDAYIFSPVDILGEPCEPLIDRLHGDAFADPLLLEYPPLRLPDGVFAADRYRIGDPATGDYSYLVPVQRDSAEIRLALLRGGKFSLLETDRPIPTRVPQQSMRDYTGCNFYLTRATRQAWVQYGDPVRAIFLRIDYGPALTGGKAGTTLFVSEPLESGIQQATPLSDGRFFLAGGGPASPLMNFLPVKTAFLLTPEDTACAPWLHGWRIVLLALLGAGILALAVLLLCRRKRPAPQESAAEKAERELIEKVAALMEQEELFRQQSLKVLDVAQRLGTNVTYISACINNVHGGTFNDFVNRYRVRYAQQWLLDHPDRKVTEAVEESGFSSEASFFRNFKALTGQAPSEWLAAQKNEKAAR